MARGRAQPPSAPVPFTRKEFYNLAAECRAYATELARFEPQRIQLEQARRMNAWLRRVKQYERLGPRIVAIRPARPVARWQVATLTLVAWLLVYVWALNSGQPLLSTLLLNGSVLLFISFYMLPERVFGTTVEELEGKLLRVVQALEEMLAQGETGFTEAAFFQAKENLEQARRELRQQIDLAHRE